MHLPFVEVEGAKSTLRIGVAGSNFFSFVPGLRSDNINTDLSIRRRPGHKNLSCLVLPLHPGKMLIQRYGPFLSWPNRPTVYKVPHSSLPFLGDSHTLPPKQFPFLQYKVSQPRTLLVDWNVHVNGYGGGLQLGILSFLQVVWFALSSSFPLYSCPLAACSRRPALKPRP